MRDIAISTHKYAKHNENHSADVLYIRQSLSPLTLLKKYGEEELFNPSDSVHCQISARVWLCKYPHES